MIDELCTQISRTFRPANPRVASLLSFHIHVRRERMTCKFWLEPVELADNHGFRARNLNQTRLPTMARFYEP